MSAHDDRHRSTAANVVDVIVGGLQLTLEFAGGLLEGVFSLVVGLFG